MVRGLDIFKKSFVEYSDQYVLIGGVACSLAMAEAGIDFRATSDLDIVLIVEAQTDDFVKAFWDFIKSGEYNHKQKSTNKPQFYRFHSPRNNNFPKMLELFSRKPDLLDLQEETHLTPIPVDEALSSLSAILIDDEYYDVVRRGMVTVDGLSFVKADHLIPLKIRAWLDLSERRKTNEKIDSKDIRKHRDDVFRLFQVIELSESTTLLGTVKEDMLKGLDRLLNEEALDLKNLGIKNRSVLEVVEMLRTKYEL
ncbi:MAG: hypothetical protein DRP45_08495 [Candidatus Zixiibacteriota bacterium]|nr:MAG: hypothetical protein DRP45_08495 [candidate division Zixibacteria bacterium]